jgi:glyceraldehyde-3-phosphate dehydrogenase (NADP+)
VLCLGPYNYPLNETFALLIPALIMEYGSVQTSKTWRFINFTFIRSFQEQLSIWVINVVYGRGREVAPIMKSGKVAVLALIGNSTSIALQDQHPNKIDYA